MSALYRLLLRLLPAAVRERHGEQMLAVFEDMYVDACRRQGPWAAWMRAVREDLALLRFAWRERHHAPAPRSIDERMLSWSPQPGRIPFMHTLVQDLRYAIRLLRRTPGFTAVCIATMALAIGANTAIFSVVHGVLLKALPHADPERLVVLGHRATAPQTLNSTTPGNFYDWQARATAFESMAGFGYTERIFTWNDRAERVLGVISAGSIFEVLGRTTAAQGRTFGASEDKPGGEAVVVLGHALAARVFGTESPLGRSLSIGGVPFTVIGVMPPDFTFPDYNAEYWIPARFAADFRGNRDQYFLLAVARLKAGLSVDQARAQLDTVMDGIRRDHPMFTQDATAGVVPLRDTIVDNVRTRLSVLMGAVALILLIACANLGNLLLARAATRRREVAVRHALGARPMRLIRQLLTESLVLSTLGGILGIAFAYALLDTLVSWLPEGLPRANEIGLDLRVLGFTAAVSLAAGIVFGFLPAVQLTGRAPMEAVREGTRGSRSGFRLRRTLVIAEVALTLLLLAGAGLLTRSFLELLDVDPGFRATGLLTFRVGLPSDVYRRPDQRVAFFESFQERIRSLPGVEAVAIASYLPASGYGTGAWFNILDKPTPPDRTPPGIPYRVVSPNYLETLGIPVLRGRGLNEFDRVDGTRAVVVSEAVARRFWPDEDPIGQKIYLGAPDNRLFPDADVVGIVANVKQLSLEDEAAQTVYSTHRMMPFWSGFTIVVRSPLEPTALVESIRAELRKLDAGVPLHRVQPIEDVLATSRAPARSSMFLVGLFAVLALTLALIGVFGVLSYTVHQRSAELGIRIALGATAGSVTRLVFGQGMVPVMVGLALGLAGALALTRYLEGMLFGVTPTDPLTFAGVSMLLVAVAAIASYLPARRATRVDPVTVLRQE